MTRRPLRPAHLLTATAAALALGGCASMPGPVREYRSRLAFAPVQGETMAYVDAGPRDGEVIVLTHGLPTSSYLYRKVIPPLTARGFRVIAPDFVGFGASSKPEDEAAYALPLQAARLLALLDQLGVERFSLVVHDLGGLVSFELLDHAPERVARLLVLDTTAYREGFEPPREMRMLGGWMGGVMAATMRGALLGPALTRSFFRDQVGDPGGDRRRDGPALLVVAARGGGDPHARRGPELRRRHRETSRASRRRCAGSRVRPRLLWGGEDRVLPFGRIAPASPPTCGFRPSGSAPCPEPGTSCRRITPTRWPRRSSRSWRRRRRSWRRRELPRRLAPRHLAWNHPPVPAPGAWRLDAEALFLRSIDVSAHPRAAPRRHASAGRHRAGPAPFEGLAELDAAMAGLERGGAVEPFWARVKAAGAMPLVFGDTAVFLHRSPAAHVEWRGDFTDWESSPAATGRRLGKTDVWTFRRTFLPGARVDYKIVEDGKTWLVDPLNPRKQGGGFGPNSEVRMPGWTEPSHVVHRPGVAAGTFGPPETFESKRLGYGVNVRVYVPAQPAGAARRLPILYVTDGSDYWSEEMGTSRPPSTT